MTPICVDIETGASMIGMSTTVLRGYIDSGLLPTIKFPSAKHHNEKSRRVLLAVDDLRAFVAKYRVAEPAP